MTKVVHAGRFTGKSYPVYSIHVQRNVYCIMESWWCANR